MNCQTSQYNGIQTIHLLPKSCTKCDLVKKRREKFKNELAPYVKDYGREMMNEFFAFWTELNKSQTRMRWENENTWETSKRLARWDRTNFKSIKTSDKGAFPNYYDRQFEKGLDTITANKYAQHLLSIGYKQQRSHEGAIVGYIKT